MNASSPDEALGRVLRWLSDQDYRFVMPSPATHRRVSARRAAEPATLARDIFGWTRPFDPAWLPEPLRIDLATAGALVAGDDGCRLNIRCAWVEESLHLHSAPGSDPDAVFLGPDTYRYIRFLRDRLQDCSPKRILEIGTGSGAAAIALAKRFPQAQITASDINPLTLRYASVNAHAAGAALETLLASGVPTERSPFDLIVANPPYVAGPVSRTYRDGGDQHGAALALDWVRAGLDHLTPGGQFILYTGSAVIDGRDVVHGELRCLIADRGASMLYEEIDPDVFGGLLGQQAYSDTDRIAAVGAVIRKD